MNFSDVKQLRPFGLSSVDSFYVIFIIIYLIAYFILIYILNSNKADDLIKEIIIPFLLNLQIALLSALALGFIYIYQLTKNTSYLYLALCWLAHGIYKLFTLKIPPVNFRGGAIQNYEYLSINNLMPNIDIHNSQVLIDHIRVKNGEEIGHLLVLIGMIALAADLPLFLSGFKQEELKKRYLLIPTVIIIPLLFVTYFSQNIFNNVKTIWFLGPLQSLLILLWLSYKTLNKNVFKLSPKLKKILTFIFVLLAVSQLVSIYTYSLCPIIKESCFENKYWDLFWKSYSTLIFLLTLLLAFMKAKYELSKKESTEKQLEVKEKQLEVKGEFESLGYLAASIEHEIRNPLEVIKGEITDLNNRFQNSDDINFKNQINNLDIQVDRLSLAANIIEVLRLKKERFTTYLKDTLVIDRVKNALKYIKKEFPLWSDIVTIHENEKTKRLFVLADKSYLEQVFINLLKNSYDAIKRTGKRGEIFIDVYLVDKESVGITFSDTGDGFLLEDIPNLTKPDYTKKEKSRSESNRGLGLFVCEKIVSLHNGKIYFSNNSKGGAEVKIELPRYFPKKEVKTNIDDSNG